MKEAQYYNKNSDGSVKCQLCPNYCTIPKNHHGRCYVRFNKQGILYSLVYGHPSAINIDPIEKKPLYHFLPGSKTFSIGTIGCNLSCKHCQNWSLVHSKEIPEQEIPPEMIIKMASNAGCKSIAFTYNEPTIFYEYMIDIAMLAKKNRIKTLIVSNGYINKEPLLKLCSHIDAANIDLKSFSQDFYSKICSGSLTPVLESLKILSERVWLEVTTLLIPGLNDREDEIINQVEWIKKNLKTSPLHFSAYHPDYKMKMPRTPHESLECAKTIAEKRLPYVYIGNIPSRKHRSTYCPQCHALVIERNFGSVQLKKRCSCGQVIAGIWD